MNVPFAPVFSQEQKTTLFVGCSTSRTPAPASHSIPSSITSCASFFRCPFSFALLLVLLFIPSILFLAIASFSSLSHPLNRCTYLLALPHDASILPISAPLPIVLYYLCVYCSYCLLPPPHSRRCAAWGRCPASPVRHYVVSPPAIMQPTEMEIMRWLLSSKNHHMHPRP